MSDEVAEHVLAEQVEYYRARAGEYDRWFRREGRYDRGAEATRAWNDELDDVRGVLRTLSLDGANVLELAPGTGIWTEQLLAAGANVHAVDAAPEMLEQLSERCPGDRLSTELADLFEWAPARRYDAVVACFFMSHVPDERFGSFTRLLADALVDGGRLFLLDSLADERSTAADHVLPEGGEQTMRRRLDDGRSFEIVKRFREDAELLAPLLEAGIDAVAIRTQTYFQMAIGTRRASTI